VGGRESKTYEDLVSKIVLRLVVKIGAALGVLRVGLLFGVLFLLQLEAPVIDLGPRAILSYLLVNAEANVGGNKSV